MNHLSIFSFSKKSLNILGIFIFFCLIVSLVFGLNGSYVNVPKSEAAGDFNIQTGSYLGKGVTMSVTGLGFTPEVVIIKSDTAAGALIWKSSAMASNVSSYLGVATGDNTENVITFDADGFSLSTSTEVNTVNVTYTFIAYAGSDCTSGGVMCVGLYTGDNNATKKITTGFQPDLILVKKATAVAGSMRTSTMSDNNSALLSAAAISTTGLLFTTIESDGFNVGLTNNTIGGLFYYLAFKNTPNKLTVGSFVGNAVDNRNITGLGFEPDFVFIKADAIITPAFSTTEMYGDFSAFATVTASATNHIQELQADGFQVGGSTNVNGNGVVSYYFAFGGSPDPNPAGSFLMHKGSYVGNGTTQLIETPFTPNLVSVKATGAQYAVWSTSLEGDVTQYYALSGAGFTGGILTADNGFNVGSNSSVNSLGINYEYVVFGNATSPRKGDGAEDFYIGSYTGNGIDSRAIDHLNFNPSLVVIKRSNGTANFSFFKLPPLVMPSGSTGYFTATADVGGAAHIKSLDTGGFTLGTNAGLNALGATYVWFAFKEGANFDVGSYTGNATADREVDGLGFTPDWVWVKRDTAVAAVQKSSSSTITEGESQFFTNAVNATNYITSLTLDGFTLGTANEVNASAGTYRYMAWKSSTTTAPPVVPVNTAPASSAVAQNLNPTLSAPYSDVAGDPQTNAQWQIDDDSDFSSPVWTRTAGVAEVSVVVNTTNGTFANELSAKTELAHDTVYYWRVRYSDGVYSDWSTATSFTTNEIVQPVNYSPGDEGSVTTLTPILMASAFSDPQSGHTANQAQWQITINNDFSSPIHDSGAVAYSTSYAVPNAVLSDRNSYHWRVRYADSNSHWSEYSESSSFSVAESGISVTPAFGNISVDQGDVVKIDAQVKLASGAVINDATVTLDIFNPSGTKIVTNVSMDYLSGSDGVYRYSYTVPGTDGSYLYNVRATSDGETGYGAANFEVGTTNASILALQNEISSINSNVDLLLGAFIAANSSVNDISASTSSFVSSLSNSVDDFYKNSVLTFTSGALSNQTRRISGYDGDTKAITLKPNLTSAPANGDTFTIVKQNVYVEEQAENLQSDIDIIKIDVAYIKSKVDEIFTLLESVDSKLDTAQTSLSQVRSTQQKFYKATITDTSELTIGDDYYVKLQLLDYESSPVDPDDTPTITIYDSLGVSVSTGDMTRLDTSLYEYEYEIESDATGGQWRAEVSTSVGNLPNQLLVDLFYVKGSPAQVIINSINSTGAPEVSANVTIQNEGNGDYEYQYEWCVVETEGNECGGVDDVYYGSAAKFITVGELFTTDLSATVPLAGDYFFKLVVHYGNESSGASRSFSVVADEEDPVTPPSGSSGGSYTVVLPNPVVEKVTLDSLYSEMLDIKNIVLASSSQLAKALDVLGIKGADGKTLMQLAGEQLIDFKSIQNKISELGAVSSSIRQVVEQDSVTPIVQAFMTFNSVEINFLIINPSSTEQTVKFKSLLPAEVKPEYIMQSDGLTVDFDATANAFYVSADIVLGPKASVTRKVEIEDVWVFPEDELNDIKKKTNDFYELLKDTQYGAQGALLKSEIASYVDMVLLRQVESYSSPQNHIVAYRENKIIVQKINDDFAKMKELMVQSGADGGLFGRLGGIQLFSTWGIILVVLFGFAGMAVILLKMWKNQNRLVEVLLERHDSTHSDVSNKPERRITDVGITRKEEPQKRRRI